MSLFMRDRKYENWFLSYQTDNEAGETGATLAAFRLHTFHGSLLPSFRPIHLFSPSFNSLFSRLLQQLPRSIL